ncbi:MAG: hypothetical protein OXC18_17830 [Desulfurellaceae bacterium]|nr:hypothetical protein [Desulfurellaceae bacterium]
MLRRLFISLLALVGASLGGAVAGPGTAQAQGSDIDLIVSIEVPARVTANSLGSGPTVTLTNGGSDTAYAVKVVIEADNVSLDPTSNSPPGKIAGPPIGSVALRDAKLIWSIDRLPGKTSHAYTVIPAKWASGIQVVQYVATASSRGALEPAHNNRAEVWQVRRTGNFDAAKPGYAVSVAVDDRFPQSGGSTTFTVKASITAQKDASAHLRDARVALDLPAGLTFSTPTPPPTGTYDPNTGIWTIGDWHLTGSPPTKAHSLTLTATRGANTVLNEQCVTAEISAKPPEPIRPTVDSQTADNRTTVCLGAPPDELVLFQSGEVELWTPYPCVSKTTHPCTTADTVEVVTVTTIEKWGSGQIIKSSPEKVNVFIQVDPAKGRTVDTHAQSVSTVSWQTKRTETSHGKTTVLVPGVTIGFTRREFNDEIANWSTMVIAASVSGIIDPAASDQTCDMGDPSPPCAPGRMKVRAVTTGNTIFDPNPSHTRNPLNLTSPSNSFVKFFAEFATLGTYVVDFKADVTHTNTNVYSGTNRSIFHVGPVAELAVRDAGPSPDTTPSQRAFTILAVNNGPDAAPAAQVTVDLQGATVSQAIASQGNYSNGVWTIGELSIDPTIAPTLTLITTAPADTPITATITNTQDYEVCISSSGDDLDHDNETDCEAVSGASWHTAKYYDYISDNNEATITAQVGTHRATSTANITVEWTAQTGASSYQIWRQGSPWTLIAEVPAGQTNYIDQTAEPGRAYLYTVRALDAQGIPVSMQTIVAAVLAAAPVAAPAPAGPHRPTTTAIPRPPPPASPRLLASAACCTTATRTTSASSCPAPACCMSRPAAGPTPSAPCGKAGENSARLNSADDSTTSGSACRCRPVRC